MTRDPAGAARQRVEDAVNADQATFRAYCERLGEATGIRAGAYVAADPITNVVEFQLYTDDGRGNGGLVFTVDVDDLVQAIAKSARRRASDFEGI